MTIYDQLRREQGITAAVHAFYARVTADPQLSHYFEDVDLVRLRAHQAKLIAHVTGGPQAYAGRSLAEAHGGLGIQEADFDRVVEHLGGTLADLGVESETIRTIADVLGSHRDDIVSSRVAVSR